MTVSFIQKKPSEQLSSANNPTKSVSSNGDNSSNYFGAIASLITAMLGILESNLKLQKSDAELTQTQIKFQSKSAQDVSQSTINAGQQEAQSSSFQAAQSFTSAGLTALSAGASFGVNKFSGKSQQIETESANVSATRSDLDNISKTDSTQEGAITVSDAEAETPEDKIQRLIENGEDITGKLDENDIAHLQRNTALKNKVTSKLRSELKERTKTLNNAQAAKEDVKQNFDKISQTLTNITQGGFQMGISATATSKAQEEANKTLNQQIQQLQQTATQQTQQAFQDAKDRVNATFQMLQQIDQTTSAR